MTIRTFLADRLAEDERQALKHQRNASRQGWGDYVDRVLSEVPSKRALVALHQPVEDTGWLHGEKNNHQWCTECGSVDDRPVAWPCGTLKIVASVYAGHKEFQEIWRL